MFVKKVVQLVQPFLANLHPSSSKKYSQMYSMTPKFFLFSQYEYQKYAEFYADFKSVEVLGKGAHRSYLPETFAN
jgi:hypothetical protein